jgi:endonuclease/exonuclease/phosphatase (EEP) superfamily protein YafD
MEYDSQITQVHVTKDTQTTVVPLEISTNTVTVDDNKQRQRHELLQAIKTLLSDVSFKGVQRTGML